MANKLIDTEESEKSEVIGIDQTQCDTLPSTEEPSTSNQHVKEEDSTSKITANYELCGFGSVFHPAWLQWLRKPSILTVHFAILTIFIYIHDPYFGAILSTIERQFGLDSFQSLLLSKIDNVTFLLVCIPIPYIAGKTNRPLWLFFCVVAMAIGNFVCTLPHFLSEPLDPESLLLGIKQDNTEDSGANPGGYLCHTASLINETSVSCERQSSGFGLSAWILIGQLLFGLGEGGYYAIFIAYLYDVLRRDSHRLIAHSSAVWIIGSLGPAFGFGFAGYVLSLYVDFERVAEFEIPAISQNDPRWIGAWWVGFPIIGVLLLLVGVPLLFYPKQPYQKDNNIERQETFVENVKEFLPEIQRILKQPLQLLFIIDYVFEIATLGIYLAFSSKYFEIEFGISPSSASTINAALLVPCSWIGVIVSASVTKRFKLSSKQCGQYVLVNSFLIVTLLLVAMFVGCENRQIAGINEPYSMSTDTMKDITCKTVCGCSTSVFQPVCGSNGTTYLSPCLAGCLSSENDAQNQTLVYNECSCASDNPLRPAIYDINSTSALSGLCDIQCGNSFVYFLMIMAFVITFWFMDNNPLLLIVLESADNVDRNLLFGIASFVGHLFVDIPTSIYFGAVINSTCILWQTTSCGSRGSCWLYDIVNIRYAFVGINIAVAFLTLILTFTFFVLTRNLKPKTKPNETQVNLDGFTNNIEQ